MATVNFSVRMDADLKREVEAIYAELGMNLRVKGQKVCPESRIFTD